MGMPNQPVNENTSYQHTSEQRQEIQNLIGDFQRPPEVIEQEPVETNNPRQVEESRNQDPILNQQWGEQIHLQPLMRPTNVPTPQVMNNVNNTTNSNGTAEVNIEVSVTQ